MREDIYRDVQENVEKLSGKNIPFWDKLDVEMAYNFWLEMDSLHACQANSKIRLDKITTMWYNYKSNR